MVTLQDKLDNIYQTKLEIKSAIGTDSDVFSEYPAMIRSMAGGGVSYSYLDERLSYYVETSDLESMGYATETYVTNAISAIPSVDLSSYVTYTYLESCGYATQSYVADYVSEHGSSVVIDEDLIPKESYTYSLGSKSYMYKAAYLSEADTNVIRYNGNILFTNQYNNTTWGIGDNLVPNQNNTYNIGRDDYRVSSTYAYNTYTYNNYLGSSKIYHYADNNIYIDYANGKRLIINPNTIYASPGLNLGTNNLPINNIYTSSTYTNNLYLGSYNITDMINGMFSYDTTTGTLTITTL